MGPIWSRRASVVCVVVSTVYALNGCAADPSGVPGNTADSGAPEDIPSPDSCPDDPMKEEPGVCGCGVPDNDGDADGSVACNDCDDSDESRFPGATDVCNGMDEDCDSFIDEDCEAGCADGTREGFLDTVTYPDIAACESAWSIPGSLGDGSPSCDREAGNDGSQPTGDGCDIDDSCAAGWHVCSSVAEVAAHTDSCEPAYVGSVTEVFYAAAVSGTEPRVCASSGSNDVYGCGNTGGFMITDCGVLDRVLGANCTKSNFECLGASPDEALQIIKFEGPGGALCCRDPA